MQQYIIIFIYATRVISSLNPMAPEMIQDTKHNHDQLIIFQPLVVKDIRYPVCY